MVRRTDQRGGCTDVEPTVLELVPGDRDGRSLVGRDGRDVAWTGARRTVMILRVMPCIIRMMFRDVAPGADPIGMIGTVIIARQSPFNHREENEE